MREFKDNLQYGPMGVAAGIEIGNLFVRSWLLFAIGVTLAVGYLLGRWLNCEEAPIEEVLTLSCDV